LFLSSNKITKIRGLETLVNLKELYLDENRIERIENLNKIKTLSSLNLAGNKIEFIGSTLDGLPNLTNLNLASNHIGNFKEILNLDRLSSLQTVTFSD
jgi:Leucine-rich repeat (LRR) protein